MTRWQKRWSTLSSRSRRRILRYARVDSLSIRKVRAGLFSPRYGRREQRRRDRLENLIFQNALRNNPDIQIRNSAAHPYAAKDSYDSGYIGMPKDPVKEAMSKGYCAYGVWWCSGHYRRATLEHEISELFVMRIKATKTPYGKALRTHKCIRDKQADHSSVHPLIAEANVAGRHSRMLRSLVIEWGGKNSAQRHIFGILKQHGWTPANGLPMYGRVASKVQKAAERVFAPSFQELIHSQLSSLERKYKGRKLRRKKELILSDVYEYAGGRGLRRKYLK